MIPVLIHQMCILTTGTLVSSVLLKQKKLEIEKKIVYTV
jgi:hypothetical protein